MHSQAQTKLQKKQHSFLYLNCRLKTFNFNGHFGVVNDNQGYFNNDLALFGGLMSVLWTGKLYNVLRLCPWALSTSVVHNIDISPQNSDKLLQLTNKQNQLPIPYVQCCCLHLWSLYVLNKFDTLHQLPQ